MNEQATAHDPVVRDFAADPWETWSKPGAEGRVKLFKTNGGACLAASEIVVEAQITAETADEFFDPVPRWAMLLSGLPSVPATNASGRQGQGVAP